MSILRWEGATRSRVVLMCSSRQGQYSGTNYNEIQLLFDTLVLAYATLLPITPLKSDCSNLTTHVRLVTLFRLRKRYNSTSSYLMST